MSYHLKCVMLCIINFNKKKTKSFSFLALSARNYFFISINTIFFFKVYHKFYRTCLCAWRNYNFIICSRVTNQKWDKTSHSFYYCNIDFFFFVVSIIVSACVNTGYNNVGKVINHWILLSVQNLIEFGWTW